MSDAWGEIQAIKIKRNSLRERLEQRKKERRDILGTSSGNNITLPSSSTANSSTLKYEESKSQLNEIFTTIENGAFFSFDFIQLLLSITLYYLNSYKFQSFP